ncbi:MAG: hypothetical protein ACRYF3_11635 [Janthinobacterium lividum]
MSEGDKNLDSLIRRNLDDPGTLTGFKALMIRKHSTNVSNAVKNDIKKGSSQLNEQGEAIWSSTGGPSVLRSRKLIAVGVAHWANLGCITWVFPTTYG